MITVHPVKKISRKIKSLRKFVDFSEHFMLRMRTNTNVWSNFRYGSKKESAVVVGRSRYAEWISGLQHWAINLQEHADLATPEVDAHHFRYFGVRPTAFPC